MKLLFMTVALLLSFSIGSSQEPTKVSFDVGWQFQKGNFEKAALPDFDDSGWRKLNLPHDWSIEDLEKQISDSIIGPFSKASIAKMGTGYTVGGTAWYRKHFILEKSSIGKTVYLQFDGIYMNADIWVNGRHLGNHAYGYTSFYFDITPFLMPAGQTNVVAVQVKNEGQNARWYSGSGIYRHTWLILKDKLHIEPWGVFVSTPLVSENKAEVEISTTLSGFAKGDKDVVIKNEIIDPQGKVVASADKNTREIIENTFKQKLSVDRPLLWFPGHPELYQSKVTLLKNGRQTDQVVTTFGIRKLQFDAQTGFTINGKSMELKGGCFHHDHGPLGSASIDRAEERKIQLLMEAGYNAIRCSHNPPSSYLLDVCDRLGMLVIDEYCDMWEKVKISPEDYSKYFKTNWNADLSAMIKRDRNHPSIILWSIGNEIPEAADSSGFRIAKGLAEEARKLDPTRGITEAMVDFSSFMTGKSGWENQAPHMALLDVVGYNYSFAKYEADHQKYPDRVIFASEFMPPLSLQNWQMSEKLPYVIGNFSWTAMDYIGEAGTGTPRLVPDVKNDDKGTDMKTMMLFFSPNSWPTFTNYQGDLDITGLPKPASGYQQVVWGNHKVEMYVHRPIPAGKKEITSPWGFPDELKSWNWKGHEGENFLVHVYTRCQEVKLELNGKIIGEQKVDANNSITASFEVGYEEGTLMARCFDEGKEVASQILKTTGKPKGIRLMADRSTIQSNENDLSYIRVEVVDDNGQVVPSADDLEINYQVNGEAKLAGVANGNPNDVTSFRLPHKKVFQGRGLVILRPNGKSGTATLKASAEGLKDAEINIQIK